MKEVFEKAILTYGQTAQEDVAIEEMSELMNACHYLIDTDVPRGIHLHECYKRSGTPYRPGKKV